MKKKIVSSVLSFVLAIAMVVPALAEEVAIVNSDEAIVVLDEESEQAIEDEAIIVEDSILEDDCAEIVIEDAATTEAVAEDDVQYSDANEKALIETSPETVTESDGVTNSDINGMTLIEEDSVINPLYKGILDEEAELASIRATVERERSLVQEDGSANNSTTRAISIYTSKDTAAAYLRKQMVNRVGVVTFYTDRYISCNDIFETAIAHGKKTTGREGDALKWGYKSYGYTSYSYGRVYEYDFYLNYYTNASQEKKLTQEVNKALKKMNLKGKTNYQKVRKIYDYICNHVDYDNAHVNNATYYKQYTAYAAMCEGKAVCQGYAVLFYRMCLDSGVSARVITSYTHAWNIVKIGSKYYSLDSTWDGQDPQTTHDYFLKGSASSKFKDAAHKREAEYTTKAFNKSYPMSSKDYKWK